MNSKTPKTDALVSALLFWFETHARDLPWRRTRDPYAIHVSEIMLQQTQVKTVIPYWERWMRELPTLAAAAAAPPDQLHKLWEGLGYYTRVRNLQRAAQQIVARHNGVFPQVYDDVLALSGVGRYTAGAICSIAYNQPVPILDGNVIRVLTRVFGIAENPKEKATNERLWQLAEELVVQAGGGETKAKAKVRMTMNRSGEDADCSQLNQSLMELGALVCTPRNPQCSSCPLQSGCVAFAENRVATLPHLVRRAPATARHFVAFVLNRHGKYLVRQRAANTVNAHLWEFPNVEISGTPLRAEAIFQSEFGQDAPALSPLTTVKHSITRYRITLEAFHATVGPTPLSTREALWQTPAQMHKLAFASAHRKILQCLPPDPRG